MKRYTVKLDKAEKAMLQNLLILLIEFFGIAGEERLEQVLWKLQTAEAETGVRDD